MLTIPVIMRANGTREINIPKGYKFITVENPTGYNINIYSDITETIEHRLLYVPIYTVLSAALDNGGTVENKAYIVWSGSGTDKMIIKLSKENLGVGQSLVAPGGSSSVIIAGDGVGLAKGSQLPAALTGTGNLKVAVLDTISLTAGQLNLDGSKNAGVNIQNIPHVIADNPTIANLGNLDATISSLVTAITGLKAALPQSATAGVTAAGQVTISTAATTIFNEVITGRSVAIQNTDLANNLYIGPAGVTTATGYMIPPGGAVKFDVVSGSTIAVYGVAAAALTAGKLVIN